MSSVRVRSATADDVAAVSRIGGPALLAQYEGLVDARAVQAAVDQLYAPSAVAECIARCNADPRAEFLVAEEDDATVGFLHFDAFGPEPELHRLYCAPAARGHGVGGLLMNALHDRLGPSVEYMLLVVEGNLRAVAFYERHGLHTEQTVDGLRYYSERMGVRFPEETAAFRLILMRTTRRR